MGSQFRTQGKPGRFELAVTVKREESMKLDTLFDYKMWLSDAKRHTVNGSKKQCFQVCIFHLAF